MKIYSLTATDMSNAGGPMGNNDVDVKYVRYFSTKKFAQEHAEKDYGDKIEWNNDRSGGCTSGDLSWVMYDIALVKITK